MSSSDEQSPGSAPFLRVTGLTKAYGGTNVLTDVAFSIEPGEFVGLLGPNGAGKSTLIKILSGVVRRDGGTIEFEGQPAPHLGDIADVGFIHQDLGLVDDLAIVDNLRLGVPSLRRFGPILNREAEEVAAIESLLTVGLTLDVRLPVSSLSPAEKALVAVARLMSLGARLIVVDETTSTLPPGEARRLIVALAAAAKGGASVVLVSHRLGEVLDACTRAIVMTDGVISTDQPVAGLDRDRLVSMLMPHGVADAKVSSDTKPNVGTGAVAIELENVRIGPLGPTALTLRRGEVVGLTGHVGSGLFEIALVVAGQLKPSSGGATAHPEIVRALVPPQRETQGTFADLPVLWNLTIASLAKRWRTSARLLRLVKEAEDGITMMDRLGVVPLDPRLRTDALSGGNQQKVIFGRALLQDADVLVLCEPTRGVDVATRGDLYRTISRAAAAGAAVLVATSDIEDLISVCDVAGIVDRGQIVGLEPVSSSSPERIAGLLDRTDRGVAA